MRDMATLIHVDAKVASGSTIIDTANCGSLTFILPVAANTVVALTHGDDSGLSDTAAVPAASTIGIVSGFGTGTGVIGYVGFKRYVMITVTNPVANTSIVAVKGDLKLAPTVQTYT